MSATGSIVTGATAQMNLYETAALAAAATVTAADSVRDKVKSVAEEAITVAANETFAKATETQTAVKALVAEKAKADEKKVKPLGEQGKAEIKEVRTEQLTNLLKTFEYSLAWANLAAENLALSQGSTVLKTGRHLVGILGLPEAVLEVYNTIAKWIANGAQNGVLALTEVLNSLSALGNKICDSVTVLASKTTGLFRLTAEQTAIFAKTNTIFLAFSSVAGIGLRSNEIDKCRRALGDTNITPEYKTELTKRIVHCALVIIQWLSYAALAAIVLYAIYSGAQLPDYAPLICSTSALVFTLSAYFYEKYSGLKGMKDPKKTGFNDGIFHKESRAARAEALALEDAAKTVAGMAG